MTLRTVTCVIVNDAAANIIATLADGKELNYKVEKGTSPALPFPIASKGRVTFTLTQAAGSASGPSGWACYELENGELVYRLRFGDPALGAGEFSITPNYLDRLGDAVTSVSFFGSSGPIDAANVASEVALTVEFHLGFTPKATVAGGTNAGVPASQGASGPPGGSANLTVQPHIARWDDPRMAGKRARVLAVIGRLFPMIWKETGEAHKSESFACVPANGGGTYNKQGLWGGPGTTCTTVNPAMAAFLSATTKSKWGFNAAKLDSWVAWGQHPTKHWPSVGDIYLLYRDEYKANPAPGDLLAGPHLRHVGIILQVPTAPGESWITADGGQTAQGVQAAHLNARPWQLRDAGPTDASKKEAWKQILTAPDHVFATPKEGIQHPYLGGGAESSSNLDGNRLVGWADVFELQFEKEIFDNYFKEEHYKALGTKIDSMVALGGKK